MSDQSSLHSPSTFIPFPNNETLMDYATYVVKECKTPELAVPKGSDFANNLRPTAPLGNSCVCPLVAARGWALLSKVAGGKTSETVAQKTAKIVGCDVSQIHEVVNSPSAYNQGVVAFFAEFSRGSRFNEDLVEEIKKLYGDVALSKMCFSCDHDGIRSMSFINMKIEEATDNGVHYVVREENAPNRRAATVLVSAVDCTFSWKHTGSFDTLKANFYDLGRETDSCSVVKGWRATGNFACLKDSRKIVLVLESQVAGFHLILYKSHNNEFVSAKEVLEAGRGIRETLQTTVFVPQFSVATPLCMRDCSVKGKYNMERVFDREKSDLSGYLSKFHPFSPTITTLWDHYHKAVFTIINRERYRVGAIDRRQIGFVPQPYAVWNWCNDLPGQCCKYYEQRLPRPPVPSCLLDREEVADAVADVAFDEPFYFLMVHNLQEYPLVQCFGRFTNADAVYSGKKKEKTITV